MERSLFRYILNHTWKQQAWLLLVTVISFPLLYVNLELPKIIVNQALSGKKVPATVLGFDVTQVSYLMVLSLTLLALITLNGGIKYYLNVYRGIIGERMVRRLRYELYSAVLRFPLPHFKKSSAGETIPMITAETDAIGGFIGDSIGMPAFQGGLLLTYLLFIFVQDFWLGLAAVALYPPQVWLIPRLQRKINELSKQRIQTTRALSDRIGDTIGGAAEIRANDTSRYEQADISNRLGRIYAIRVEIYNRKYFVKFLNNFLAQITPFFFYSVGGYFVIKGQLSLGALVAVLAAYKDLIDPWKELLTWYATKEDCRVKYDQIVSQFEPPGMFPPALVDERPAVIPRLSGPVVASGVAYSEDGFTNEVERVSFEVAPGEHVALLGTGRSGKEDVAKLLARLTMPSAGRLAIGDVNLATAPEAVTGARIAYVTQNAYVFSGTLLHNLLYGLKHRVVEPPRFDGADAEQERRRIIDAILCANTPDSVYADWVDRETAGIEDRVAYAREILFLVGMEEVLDFGLSSTLDPARAQDREQAERTVALVLEARNQLRDALTRPEHARYVERFDPGRYHTNVSVAENIVFGTPLHPDFRFDAIARNPEVRALLREVGVLDELVAAGERITRLMVELFADVAPESDLFVQYSFLSPDDLDVFKGLLKRIDDRGMESLGPTDRELLVGVTMKIVVTRHRLGVGNVELQRQIVAAREEFRRRFADRGVVDFFDPTRYSPALSIQDNILFGRAVYDQANAQAHVGRLIRETALQVGMEEALVRRGLDYDVGSSGARLSYSQKQRLAIARGLMKNPDILIMNEATAGLDPASERRLLARVLEWAKGRTVIWALGRAELAREFDRVLVLEGGRLVEQGRFGELEQGGALLPKLLAA